MSPLQSGFRSTHLTSGRNPKNLRKKSETFPSLIFHGCIVTSAKWLQRCQYWFQVHPPHSKTFDLHFTECKYFCRHGYIFEDFFFAVELIFSHFLTSLLDLVTSAPLNTHLNQNLFIYTSLNSLSMKAFFLAWMSL